jgi:hypothetical protein
MSLVIARSGGSRRFWLFVLALLATTAFAGASRGTAPAGAYSDNFCWYQFVGAHESCYGPDHHLMGVVAYDAYGSDRVCAGANYNGSLFVSYVCGYGIAERCYSGTHALKPKIHNQEDFGQTMRGQSFFGEPCP